MALSVVQCVAKRRRQLERLEFALAASARRLSAAAGTARRSPVARSMLSETAQLQISYSYAQLLLAALDMEKEQQPTAEQLFASALVLEVRDTRRSNVLLLLLMWEVGAAPRTSRTRCRSCSSCAKRRSTWHSARPPCGERSTAAAAAQELSARSSRSASSSGRLL